MTLDPSKALLTVTEAGPEVLVADRNVHAEPGVPHDGPGAPYAAPVVPDDAPGAPGAGTPFATQPTGQPPIKDVS